MVGKAYNPEEVLERINNFPPDIRAFIIHLGVHFESVVPLVSPHHGESEQVRVARVSAISDRILDLLENRDRPNMDELQFLQNLLVIWDSYEYLRESD